MSMNHEKQTNSTRYIQRKPSVLHYNYIHNAKQIMLCSSLYWYIIVPDRCFQLLWQSTEATADRIKRAFLVSLSQGMLNVEFTSSNRQILHNMFFKLHFCAVLTLSLE